MNYSQAKAIIQDAMSTLEKPLDVARYLCRQKLLYVLENWPDDSTEMARLQKFEIDARRCLGGPYSIQPASWKNSDGSPHFVRILDEKEVLEVLGLKGDS